MVDSKRIQQLDLNLLKVFQSLYQEQNMTRTAEALHLTPSAVSHAIKRLRDALDDPLFQRSQNKMVPTAACQRMAPKIIESLSYLQQVLQQWGEFEPAQSEHNFRIGMHDALEPVILPMLTGVLAKRAPKVGFASVKIDRSNLARELSAGSVDIALDVTIDVKKPIKQAELWSSKFAVLMRKKHPLKEILSQEQYLASQHISVSNRPHGMTIEDTFFQQLGVNRQTNIRCQNYLAATQILKSSDQLLTVTKIMADHLLDKDLITVESPFDIPRFGISMYWHEHGEQDSASTWLRTILEEINAVA